VEDCDFLFSIGARFDDRVAGKVAEFAPKAKFIGHMDIDPAEIGKVKVATWSHVADAKRGLRDLIDAGKRIGFKKDISAWWRTLDANSEESRAQLRSEKSDDSALQSAWRFCRN
jgi:thiamine pyrophosphate-dependent acetolactate synthase large subunit-like protein